MNVMKTGLLVLVVAISAGLIGFTSWAAMNSSENRSRAATATEKIYKSWEFSKSGNTEGWTFANFSGIRVSDGQLRAEFTQAGDQSRTSMSNTSVATALPQGAKSIKMRFGVSKGTKPVTATITYVMKGTTTPSKPFTVTVPSDGQLRDVSVSLPEIAAMTMTGITVSFSGFQPGGVFMVDWIRLVGAVLTPTPYATKRPTPTSSIPKQTPTPPPSSSGGPQPTASTTPPSVPTY